MHNKPVYYPCTSIYSQIYTKVNQQISTPQSAIIVKHQSQRFIRKKHEIILFATQADLHIRKYHALYIAVISEHTDDLTGANKSNWN